jgi:hypothetical protein
MAIAINQPQTIIHRLPGHQVPKELLETALRKCPTVSGFAIRDTLDGNTTLETDRLDKATTIENLTTLDTQSKDYETVLYLANLPGKFTKDDVQPYVLTVCDEENDTSTDILSIFLEGDFPKYAKEGHTDEYNFYKEIIEPTLQDMFMAANQDGAVFIASLHKPLFEKQMMAHVGHRAAFVFLPLEGDAIKFGNNELGLGDDWGTCSQHLDFQKAAKPITNAVTNAASAVKKRFSFGKPALPDGVHAVPKPSDKPLADTATSITAGKKLIKPPAGLDKTARNRWIRVMNNGQLPNKHDHRDFEGVWVSPEMVPFAERVVRTIGEVEALATEMRTGVRKVGNTTFVDKNRTTSYPSSFNPVLDDVEMTSLTSTLSKFIDREKVPSVLDIQKIEKPYPTFSEKGGIPFTDSLRWTGDEAFALSHQQLALLWMETRQNLISRMNAAEIASLDPKAKVKDLTGTHVEAKNILKPDGSVASTVTAKRNAIFGKKSA